MISFPSEDDFSVTDLEGPIAGNNCADPSDFARQYRDATTKNGEDDHSPQSRVYLLIAELCDFHFKPEDKVEPFSNRVGWGDGARTLVGSDCGGGILGTLAATTASLKNDALRTRIADLVWSREKWRKNLGRVAVDGYVSLLRSLVDGTCVERFGSKGATGLLSQQYLQRAAIIARAIGWTQEANEPLRQMYETILRIAKAEGGVTLVRFGDLATDIRLDAADDLLTDLPDMARAAYDNGKIFDAEALQRLAIRRARLAKNGLEKERTLELVSLLEKKGDSLTNSAMLCAHALHEALDALHGLKGVREERQRLHEKLREAQLHMYEEFGSFEHGIDLTDEVSRILKGFEGLDLLECLRRLAFTELPRPKAKLEQDAAQQMSSHPLSSLFSTSIVDGKGRTTARVPGGPETAERLRYQVIKSEDIRMGVSVAGAISPIRAWITEQFTVDEHLLFEICKISPFVPSGAEHTIARGLQAFLYSDDQVACALLVPYLEAGLRAMVTAAGKGDTKISVGGIEETIGLSALLSNHREVLEQVFGSGIVYCIENLFIHEHGSKVRHNFCHGLSSDGSYYTYEYVYASKLIYSLVVLPLSDDQEWPKIKDHLVSAIERPIFN